MKFRLRRTTSAPSTLDGRAPVSFREATFDPRVQQTPAEELVDGRHESLAGQYPEAERGDLVIWARGLANEGLVLPQALYFKEKPLVPVWVDRVSAYAARQLTTIVSAGIHKRSGGWGNWTPAWFQEREDEAFGALRAMRLALDEHANGEQLD